MSVGECFDSLPQILKMIFNPFLFFKNYFLEMWLLCSIEELTLGYHWLGVQNWAPVMLIFLLSIDMEVCFHCTHIPSSLCSSHPFVTGELIKRMSPLCNYEQFFGKKQPDHTVSEKTRASNTLKAQLDEILKKNQEGRRRAGR